MRIAGVVDAVLEATQAPDVDAVKGELLREWGSSEVWRLSYGLRSVIVKRGSHAQSGEAEVYERLVVPRGLPYTLIRDAVAYGHQSETIVTRYVDASGADQELPEAQQLIGDRSGPDALETGEWDGVIDMSGFLIGDVRRTAELLRYRVARYTFMSSIAVYASKTRPGMTGFVVGA